MTSSEWAAAASWAAMRAASATPLPFSYSTFANSTMRIAFLADKSDQHDETDLGKDVILQTKDPECAECAEHRDRCAEKTLNGNAQLSYCAARIRKTNSSEKPKITLAGTPSARSLFLKRHTQIVIAHFARHRLAKTSSIAFIACPEL